MRQQTVTFIRKFLAEKRTEDLTTVLDVGSMDVSNYQDHGLDLRKVFNGIGYTGSDMRKGPNVDVVVNGHDLVSKFGENKFDIVCCFDTLEHDDAFWLTVDQMKQVLRPGGYLLIGAPSRNCPLHDHPYDYWRFMRASFERVFFNGMSDVYVDLELHEGSDLEDEVYGWGKKI